VDGLWATKSDDVALIVLANSFQDFQPMWSWSTNVTDRLQPDRRTDRQTDRQTTCNLNTALCTEVRRALKMTTKQHESGKQLVLQRV